MVKKYEIKKLIGMKPDDGNVMIQCAILNELAEANRLKRLELSVHYASLTDLKDEVID